MLCQEIETNLLDYHDNVLPPSQRAEVEAHLAGCADCRVFAQELRKLDAALSTVVKVPALSEDFDQLLYRRVQLSSPLSGAALAERKRQLQAEFDADMARIARGSFFLGSLLEHLAWPTLIAAMAFLAWCIALRLNPQRLGGFDPKLFPWLAASGVFLVAGLVQAFPRQWKALRFW
jgi:anti-sigma factor RsiW